MLMEPTFAKLRELKLYGLLAGLQDQLAQPTYGDLAFEERVAMLVDREWTHRQDGRLKRHLKDARLKHAAACPEDIDYRHPRGLDRGVMRTLLTGEWLRRKQNVLITGPTGCGKTWLACALANQACRQGFTAYYSRLTRLLNALAMARADGSYARLLGRLARVDLLVVDDWGLAPLADLDRRDLLELLDDRHGSRSTIVTSQLPVDAWHDAIGDPTLADAILERLVHNAHKLPLKRGGKSMRDGLDPAKDTPSRKETDEPLTKKDDEQ